MSEPGIKSFEFYPQSKSFTSDQLREERRQRTNRYSHVEELATLGYRICIDPPSYIKKKSDSKRNREGGRIITRVSLFWEILKMGCNQHMGRYF